MNKSGKSKGKFNSKRPNMKYNYKKKKDEDEDDGKFEVVDQAKQNKVSITELTFYQRLCNTIIFQKNPIYFSQSEQIIQGIDEEIKNIYFTSWQNLDQFLNF